jgi:predicted transposase/invertase (TIGR01784 family)
MAEFREKLLSNLFNLSEIAKLKPEEYKQYEASMNAYRDVKNSIDTAFEKGIEKGIIKEKIEVAKGMLIKGFDIKTIVEITGLTEEEIKEIKY